MIVAGPMRGTPVGRFVLRVAAWLPAAFVVWYLAGPVLAWPIALLTSAVARFAFSDVVQAVEQHGHVGDGFKPDRFEPGNIWKKDLGHSISAAGGARP